MWKMGTDDVILIAKDNISRLFSFANASISNEALNASKLQQMATRNWEVAEQSPDLQGDLAHFQNSYLPTQVSLSTGVIFNLHEIFPTFTFSSVQVTIMS